MAESFRIENDSMGQIKVPSSALWGAQTQRSLINFAIGQNKIPMKLIHSLVKIITTFSRPPESITAIQKYRLQLINNF